MAEPLRAAELLSSRGALPQAKLVATKIREVLGAKLVEADQRKLLKLEARLSMADGGGTSETAAVLEEIVKIDPLDGEALMLLGQHYARAGGADSDPEKAIFYYERAASLEAFEATAKLRHAQVLVGMGRYADALPLIRRAQEIKPREDIARYLEQVERISRTRR
jgi:Flp pilus assembly protein TadD